MPHDIGPGDAVICISSIGDPRANAHTTVFRPVKGRAYRCIWAGLTKPGVPAIQLAEQIDFTGAWAMDRSRKLNDGEGDAETLARIKSCRPRTRVPA